MVEGVLRMRDALGLFLYRHLLKPVFFRMDPEKAHDSCSNLGKGLGSNILGRWLVGLAFWSANPMLRQKVAGLEFVSPVGLTAGFDKSAQLTRILPSLGFGFAELGSITGEPCEGNPKPRLWRLKKSKSLVVYYGLKNDGAEVIAERLKKTLPKVRKTALGKRFIYGVSVAKTNCQETVECKKGVDDYYKAYLLIRDYADYITINISCPNAFGGQPFTDKHSLGLLLNKLDGIYREGCPVFIKLSPDLSSAEVDDILEVSAKHKVDGFICTNLTKKRDSHKIVDKDVPELGGISGKVVGQLSDDLIERVYRATGGQKIVIGVGGVFSAEDAYRKIRLGANLVEMLTGMIFEGPSVISEINLGLVRLLRRDGFKNISEAVGMDVRER